ncbi:MAG: ribonuclease P protein component [Gammaproteobacteria bacterium]
MVAGRQCYTREQRLTRAADYQRLFKSAQRSSDNHLIVLASKNTVGCARLGFAVARKKIPSAVGRNRIKRLARESFRKQNEFDDLDVVVMARHDLTEVSNNTLFESLARHWSRFARRQR